MNLTKEDLEIMRETLRNMHARGAASQAAYFKGLLLVADCYVEVGDKEAAVRLLSEVSADYIRSELSVQMGEDEEFSERAFRLATALGADVGETVSKEDAEIDLLLLTIPRAKA